MNKHSRMPMIMMTLVFAAGVLAVTPAAEAKSKKSKVEKKTVKVEKTEVVTQSGPIMVAPRQSPPAGFNTPGPKGPEIQTPVFNPQGSQSFPAGYAPPGYAVAQEAKPTVTDNTKDSIAYLEGRRKDLEKRKVDPTQIEAIDQEIKSLKSSLKDLKEDKKEVKKAAQEAKKESKAAAKESAQS
ncbi:MAG: hypothetical protein HY714_01675 [Candidatus Omnitrophica bacterium]|nr:hypothetical protein [Candidatus Omnitrophota bacterium]